MKRILHALAALWLGKTGDGSQKTEEDRRARTGERRRETREDRWKKEDRLMTEDRSRKTEERSWKTEDWGLSHEGLWLPEARNGLLRHLNAMMRMGETVRELATRECTHLPIRESGKEQPSEYANQRISTSAKKSELANLQISSTNQQSEESTIKKTDNRLPKRVIVGEADATPAVDPLPLGHVLARVYLRDTPRCAMGETARPCAIADPRIGESATQQINTPAFNRSWATLTALVFTVFMCLLSAQQVSAQAEPAAAAVKQYQLPTVTSTLITNTIQLDRIMQLTPNADLERFPVKRYLVGTDSTFKGLRIGDDIPESVWQQPLWVVNGPDGKDTIVLSAYRDSPLLVLDFWAKFCTPCVESMDKWESYVRELDGDLQLMGVQLDFDYKALPAIKEKGWQSPTVIGETAYQLNRLFFQRDVISRMAWIRGGKLIAITSGRGYDLETVTDVVEGRCVDIPMDYNWTYQSGNSSNP